MPGTRLGATLRQIDQLLDGGTATGQTDSQLLARFLSRGDQLAFAALVERHGPMVLGVCRAVGGDECEVEDAFQATFMILIRRGATVRGREALGAWLHRVAYRVAVRSRIEARRRRRFETPLHDGGGRLRDRAPSGDRERIALLHEELARLPEKYRKPIVLCYLEGFTQARAALELGWGEATVRRRLTAARDLLRSRLTSRGLAPAVGLLLIDGIAGTSSAAVPRAWVDLLAKTAAASSGGVIATGSGISASAASLARATLASLFVQAAKGIATAVALLITLGMVGSHTIPVGFAQTDGGVVATENPGIDPNAQPPQRPARDAKIEMRNGRVIAPDGKPFAGARLYRYRSDERAGKPIPPTLVAISGADGSFRYPARGISEFGRPEALVAWAPGYGPALDDPLDKSPAETLKLVKDDVPIRGRIVDAQGHPVSGAAVQVVAVFWSLTGTLDHWLEKQKTDKAQLGQFKSLRVWASNDIATLFPAVMTDAEGRFTISGIGRERVASLLVEGPRIETSVEHAATRLMPTLRIPDYDGNVPGRRVTHGAESEIHVEPGQEVSGTVTDLDTGSRLAGVRIETPMLFDIPARNLKTMTDAQGRYRLQGLPLKTRFGVARELLASSEIDPYTPTIEGVGNVEGQATITINFRLKRGLWATGRVVDRETGEGVDSGLTYIPLRGNPLLKVYPPYGTLRYSPPLHTNEDGTFRLAVLPGPGVISAQRGGSRYRVGVGLDKIEGLNPNDVQRAVVTPHLLVPGSYRTVIGINPKMGEKSVAYTIELDPGRTVKGRIVDPDGKPLPGTRVLGLQDHFRMWSGSPMTSDEFLVEGIGPRASREILCYHEGKKLAGAYTITPDEAGPIVVRLEPSGTVAGRLVDEAGKPLAEAELIFQSPEIDGSYTPGPLNWRCRTGSDGRFRAEGLVPGRKYAFQAWVPGKNISGIIGKPGIVARRGETRELGNVVVTLEKTPFTLNFIGDYTPRSDSDSENP